MSTYSVAQVETLTGIKAHTLRVWERRYNFLEPSRTDTNIRYYSDEQLRKLLNIGILTRNGLRISKIDKLSEEEINEAVESILDEPIGELEDDVRGLVLSMLNYDESAFERIYQRQVATSGVLYTITHLIYPFLQQVGILWTTSRTVPAQEHFVSNLIRQKLISAIDALPAPPSDAPSILLFLLEEEAHELGLLLASFIAKASGWRTFYLGQNVPTINIIDILDSLRPDLMLSMLVVPRAEKVSAMVEEVIQNTDIPILLSGNPDNMKQITGSDQVIKISSPDHLKEMLEARKA